MLTSLTYCFVFGFFAAGAVIQSVVAYTHARSALKNGTSLFTTWVNVFIGMLCLSAAVMALVAAAIVTLK